MQIRQFHIQGDKVDQEYLLGVHAANKSDLDIIKRESGPTGVSKAYVHEASSCTACFSAHCSCRLQSVALGTSSSTSLSRGGCQGVEGEHVARNEGQAKTEGWEMRGGQRPEGGYAGCVRKIG